MSTFTPREALWAILASASTLDERLLHGFVPDDDSGAIEQNRLEAWCRAVARGDWERFDRRLAWDGLEQSRVRSTLRRGCLPAGLTLPSWAKTLDEAIQRFSVAPGNAAERLSFVDPEAPFPFEELLTPFVTLAAARCASEAAAALHLLSEEARVTLLRSLLQTLSAHAAQAFFLEFTIERELAQSLEQWLGQRGDDRTFYRRFVDHMRHGGIVDFFREYAVLARLLAMITELWVESTVEFLQRLTTDLPEIRRIVGEGELGCVATIRPSLSDPHCGRRKVLAVTFASGHRLIYKPRDQGCTAAYQRLLAWCNARGELLPFRVLAVVDRSTHGWVEFVEHAPCVDREQVQRYYRRAGMLLSLAYTLEGTDCHFENLIASGEHPVLVDVEMLMHHVSPLEDDAHEMNAWRLAYAQLEHSVLGTGLLPTWQQDRETGEFYDVSGLGDGEPEHLASAPYWEHVNTDQMALKYGSVMVNADPPANRPWLDGAPLLLDEHTAEMVAGFREMYGFLVKQREALLAEGGPLRDLGEQRVRFLYRPTRTYFAIAQKLLHPKYLRDGADRGIQLELLGRSLVMQDAQERPSAWAVFAAERRAMEQVDIPFFAAWPCRRDLIIDSASDKLEADWFRKPSFNLVTARLRAMSDEDVERQVAFIEGSVGAQAPRAVAAVQATRPEPDDGVGQSLLIAREISVRAIRAADGSATWIAPYYLDSQERFQLEPIGYSLYGGACGVALFLAAIEKFARGSEYRELALAAVQPLRQALCQDGERLAEEIGIGGGSGLGSVIYALTRLSQLLDEPNLLEDAGRAARLVTRERIAGDGALDILGGAAGAILGLLALDAVSSDEAALDRAIACGQHIVQRRTRSESGLRAWPTLDGRMLAGFSHGAAGIAYALLRLYEVKRDKELIAAAREGIAYENSLLVLERGNWQDLRIAEQAAFTTTWCHGAPGIALGRLGGLSVLDTDEIRRDIEIAVLTTLEAGVQGMDHVCCGNLGRAEVLLLAADWLARPELAAIARDWAYRVVKRASENGAFELQHTLPKRVENPGFFHGTAGIGYHLLRFAHPDVLPSVLLWE